MIYTVENTWKELHEARLNNAIVPFGAVTAVAIDGVRLTMSPDEFKEAAADYEEEDF